MNVTYLRGNDGDGSNWFRTRDGGRFDTAGYLYVEGRIDDVIVRGGENLSPGEIEDVLLEHPAVREAAVVESDLCDHVVTRPRSSRRPSVVEFRDELPINDTGKVLRRVLREELVGAHAAI